ncbi:Hypothetical protein Cul131001_0584 [Corynebacterium ulcerans]|nr:Hypothetical protein Cul131001_0584 [Corynebacterium ulcerans]
MRTIRRGKCWLCPARHRSPLHGKGRKAYCSRVPGLLDEPSALEALATIQEIRPDYSGSVNATLATGR